MSEPLTLAEFIEVACTEAVAEFNEALRNPPSSLPFPAALERLALRLLAGERERCAEAVIHAGFQYDHLKRRYLPDAVHGAVSAIRAMGDPTP